MKKPKKQKRSLQKPNVAYTVPGKAEYLAGACAGVLMLAVYLSTMCRTIYSGDAPELATAGAIFGIPHPPGYPLYCLLANIFSHLIPIGEVAVRVNLLSVFSAAGAVIFLYFTVLELGSSWIAALYSALGLGLGATIWSQALISEVYALDLLLASATLYCSLKARTLQSQGMLAGAVALSACWVSYRTVNIIYIPAIIYLIGPAIKQHLWTGRGRTICFISLLSPLLVFLYLPIASMREPLLDTGDPQTWQRFWDVVTASVYRQYLFSGPSGSFWMQVKFICMSLPKELGGALFFAPLGAYLLFRHKQHEALAFVYIAAANLFFASNYQVIDVLSFIMPFLLAVFVLAGAGASGMVRCIPHAYAASLITALLIITACFNAGENNLRSQTLCADFARDVLSYPEQQGIILTNVDSVSFALWYMQYVEKLRPDILALSKGRAVDWYQEQTQKHYQNLQIPLYNGLDPASRWPAMIVEKNADSVPVYVTANIQGYFSAEDAVRLLSRFEEIPAGLMTQLCRTEGVPKPDAVIRQNEVFWNKAWPHAVKACGQKLNTDMAALLLHYASMRVLFARYCLAHGDPKSCEKAVSEVIALNPAQFINQVNEEFSRKGLRYHMSDMPEQAAYLQNLAASLKDNKLSRADIHQKLTGASSQSRAEQVNQEGIRLAQQRKLPEALQAFSKAIEIDAAHYGARVNRAKVLSMLGETDKAITEYRNILSQSPDNVLALIGLAELLKPGDPQEAEKLYREALPHAQGSPLEGMIRRDLEGQTDPR